MEIGIICNYTQALVRETPIQEEFYTLGNIEEEFSLEI